MNAHENGTEIRTVRGRDKQQGEKKAVGRESNGREVQEEANRATR